MHIGRDVGFADFLAVARYMYRTRKGRFSLPPAFRRAVGLAVVTVVSGQFSPALSQVGQRLSPDWPPMPNRTLVRDDSQYVALWGPKPQIRVFRRIYAVMFSRQASGDSVKALLARLHAEPIGGFWAARYYFVRVPDPGRRGSDVDRILAAFTKSRAVRFADPVPVDETEFIFLPVRQGFDGRLSR